MNSQLWSPRINYSLCNGCGECLQKCPCSVFRVEHSKPVIYDPLGCNYCGPCEAICPTAAIELPYLICRATDQVILQERSKVTVNHQKNPYTFFDSLIAQLDLILADSIISRTIVTDRHFKVTLSGFAAG
ncbi:MAG: ferredoxin family protein [Anaerolineae bacterium]|nr:ferredoxin family protein [Chloroflexota bacterium]MBN8617482.1 ferredoxin family protein [Anaerolineae bacterium]